MNVTVKLVGTLVARTGAHQATVAVGEDATVADVVDRLASKHGPQVRAGVLDGKRLRSDTIVLREAVDTTEPLSTRSSLRPGDTVRFQLSG